MKTKLSWIKGIPSGWGRASGTWKAHIGKRDSLGQRRYRLRGKSYIICFWHKIVRFIKLKSAAKISLLYANYTSVKLFKKKKKKERNLLEGQGEKSPWNVCSFGIQGYSSLILSCRAHTNLCGQQRLLNSRKSELSLAPTAPFLKGPNQMLPQPDVHLRTITVIIPNITAYQRISWATTVCWIWHANFLKQKIKA